MNKSSISTIFSIIFLFAILGGFYYIWSSSSSESGSEASTLLEVPAEVADVSGLKEQAQKLTSNTENNAGLPVPAPTGKLGKTNLFVQP